MPWTSQPESKPGFEDVRSHLGERSLPHSPHLLCLPSLPFPILPHGSASNTSERLRLKTASAQVTQVPCASCAPGQRSPGLAGLSGAQALWEGAAPTSSATGSDPDRDADGCERGGGGGVGVELRTPAPRCPVPQSQNRLSSLSTRRGNPNQTSNFCIKFQQVTFIFMSDVPDIK